MSERGHEGHDHGAHEEHDHDAHAGHDHGAHEEHAHEGHDHGVHEEHDHDAHAGHDHDDHEGHDHDAHAGHDHDDHEGHDHDAHAGHDHDDHEGHDHDAHAGHDHDDHEGHDHSGHDHHGHGHHDHSHELRSLSKRRLTIALAMITTYMIAEAIGGFVAGSLALIADAGHMLTDAAAIAMALVAMAIAERAASSRRTYGLQRSEVIAALINVIALWAISIWILYEAYNRTFGAAAESHEVEGLPVLIVGTGGLIINIIAAKMLHASAEHSMNVEGALQHVIADILGSVAVIVSAIAIIVSDNFLNEPLYWIDPLLSVGIAGLIVFNSRGLFKQVFGVLLEGVPEHIDVYALCADIEDVPGVTVIHDIHVWTITSGSEAFTAHLLVDPDLADTRPTLEEIKRIVHDKYGIAHVTIQLDSTAASCPAENHHLDHLLAKSRTGH